ARHDELLRHLRVLLADAAAEPGRADDRGRLALRVDVVRVRAGLRAGLAGPGGGVEEALVRGQAGLRLLRLELSDPLAVLERGDLSAEVVDEAHRRVPVRNRGGHRTGSPPR